ncbi:hypothetical protein NP493_50g03024 [Ridgeia piscesae]|uniref:Uncharacterized protein n=1 Tax=Ridgeia piscesae TaxID=27915 RepID=A0AAD9PBJ7_RIDPI|nr:hypothetical protein NP493_50g03024 [Ridgeia piscesae]
MFDWCGGSTDQRVATADGPQTTTFAHIIVQYNSSVLHCCSGVTGEVTRPPSPRGCLAAVEQTSPPTCATVGRLLTFLFIGQVNDRVVLGRQCRGTTTNVNVFLFW